MLRDPHGCPYLRQWHKATEHSCQQNMLQNLEDDMLVVVAEQIVVVAYLMANMCLNLLGVAWDPNVSLFGVVRHLVHPCCHLETVLGN